MFSKWYETIHFSEWQKCSHPVYNKDRLIEFLCGLGYELHTHREEGTDTWYGQVAEGKRITGCSTEDDALQAAIYEAFEQYQSLITGIGHSHN